MAHVRKQIRDAVKSSLTGLSTTGANVFTNRDIIIAEDILPALVIHARSDVVDYSEGQLSATPQHILNIVVEAYVKTSTNSVSNDLDQIAAEVEVAIYADETFGGLVHGVEMIDTVIESQTDADESVGAAILSYNLFYYAREGEPETAL